MKFFCAVVLLLNYATGLLARDCNTTSVTSFTVKGIASNSSCSGDLIFEENFDNLNPAIWSHDITLSGYGKGQFQYYTDDNEVSYINSSILHIVPRLLSDQKGNDFLYNGTIDLGSTCTESSDNGCKRTGQSNSILNPILSARLNTIKSFSFKYGRLEIRMKCPSGNWLWPGVSLLPAKQGKYGAWPRSGEFNIMESRGNIDMGYPYTATSSLHWGPDNAHDMNAKTTYPKGDLYGYHTIFHIFQLEWTPEYISFSVDDHHYGKVTPPKGGFWELGDLDGSGGTNPWAGQNKMAPFDQEFYLAFHLAVGGTNGYFPETWGKPWKNNDDRFLAMTKFWNAKGYEDWRGTWKEDTDDSHMQVDYIRVYAL